MNHFKKITKICGFAGTIATFISNLVLLSVGTGVMRAEFDFVSHALIPSLISKVLILIWSTYFCGSYEYDRGARVFSRIFVGFMTVNIVFTILDYDMIWFFLFQSATALLMLVFMTMLINQKRFAIRSKKYANMLYVMNTLLGICIATLLGLLFFSFSDEYLYLFIITMVSQFFLLAAMICVTVVEVLFAKSLGQQKKPTEFPSEDEENDEDEIYED